MQRIRRRNLLTVFLASIASTTTLASKDLAIPKIPFFVHPFDNPRRLFARFHPVTKWLSSQLSDIRLHLLSSYQEQLDLITCKTQLGLAYLGPSTFYLAQYINPYIQPIAMETIGGQTHFRALLLTKIQEIETNSLFDIIGKKTSHW